MYQIGVKTLFFFAASRASTGPYRTPRRGGVRAYCMIRDTLRVGSSCMDSSSLVWFDLALCGSLYIALRVACKDVALCIVPSRRPAAREPGPDGWADSVFAKPQREESDCSPDGRKANARRQRGESDCPSTEAASRRKRAAVPDGSARAAGCMARSSCGGRSEQRSFGWDRQTSHTRICARGTSS
jgi:hypothetical protein